MTPTEIKTCHFCGDERPAFALREVERQVPSRGLLMLAGATQKRRCCTDRRPCQNAAATWVSEKVDA